MQAEDSRAGVRQGGCVQRYLDDLVSECRSAGYTVLSTRDYVRSAAHLGRWLDTHGLTAFQLTDATFEKLGRHRCTYPGSGKHYRVRSVRHIRRARRFVEYLRRIGVAPPVAPLTPKSVRAPLIGFRSWMSLHRGVANATISDYERSIAKVLDALGEDPSSYDAALIRRVVLDEVRSRSRAYAKSTVKALRMFLRFLASEGRSDPISITLSQWCRIGSCRRYRDTSKAATWNE